MKRLAIAAGVLGVLVSCTIDEENAPVKYARAMCAKMKECERGTFDSEYADMADCVEEWEEYFEGVIDFYDLLGCEIDSEGAHQAIGDLRSATCEEFHDGDWGDDADIFDCG